VKFAERYKTDAVAELEGKWVAWGEGSRVKIARIGNTHYREMVRAEMSEFDVLRSSGRKVPESDTDKVMIKCMAHTVITDWEGFSGEGLENIGLQLNEDKSIPYTTENARILLTEFKDFREEVASAALSMENFKASSKDAVAKNSQPS
jgi:hypothetical protein